MDAFHAFLNCANGTNFRVTYKPLPRVLFLNFREKIGNFTVLACWAVAT